MMHLKIPHLNIDSEILHVEGCFGKRMRIRLDVPPDDAVAQMSKDRTLPKEWSDSIVAYFEFNDGVVVAGPAKVQWATVRTSVMTKNCTIMSVMGLQQMSEFELELEWMTS